MLRRLLLLHVLVQALCQTPPAPPRQVQVDNWLLTWTPASQDPDPDVTYTVRYRSFDSDVWTDVPACVRTPSTRCNASFTREEAEHGCVTLAVRAERRGRASRLVSACSTHGDSCTPEVSLTARPGFLTVHLSRNHSLALEHEDHVKHSVYFGKDGEPLEFEDAVSSVFIKKVEEGQRYCASVQYLYFSRPVGMASCSRCQAIPPSATSRLQLTVALVVVFLLVTPLIAYIIIFQRGRIKEYLRPPYSIPDDFLLESLRERGVPLSPSSPSEEHWDAISSVVPVEPRGE